MPHWTLEARVGGERAAAMVELRVGDVGVGLQVAERVLHVAGAGGDQLGARERQRLDQPHLGVGADVGALGGASGRDRA